MREQSDPSRSDWMEEAESALERIGDSLRQAWTETRGTRLATLEAAKEAASRLGDAIDQGITVVRETWSTRPEDGSTQTDADEQVVEESVREEE